MSRIACLLVLFCVACDDGASADPDPGQQGPAPDAALPDAELPDAAPATSDLGPIEADLGPPDGGPQAVVGQCGSGSVTGWLYTDADDGDLSRYAGERAADDPPFVDAVRLLAAAGADELEACDDGSFASDELADGAYLVVPPRPQGQRCSRRNCPGSFATAVEAGAAVMVTIGDSIPVVGDRPLFPERIKTLFEGLAEIDNRNVAVAGSTSPQWLPGQRNFDDRLGPHIADADLVVISIGGNDILSYVSNPALLGDIPAAVEGAKELVADIAARVVLIVQAIREENPGVDVVYCLYPDYTQATSHQLWGLAGRLLGEGTMREVLETALAEIPKDEEIMLADMLNGWDGLDVGLYLYDALHFNDAGQSLYAEEIFETVGGVRIGASPLGETGNSPLGTARNYGYSDPR